MEDVKDDEQRGLRSLAGKGIVWEGEKGRLIRTRF